MEALIDYIEKKGVHVRTEKGYLVLYRETENNICQQSWILPDYMIEYSRLDGMMLLKMQADKRIAKFEEAFAKGPPEPLEEEI